MFVQCKYGVRQGLNQRMIGLGATVLLNIGFLLFGTVIGGGILHTTGIVFSSLAMCALFIVNIIADVEIIRSIFTAPIGYNVLMTPVAGWKILLGRVLPMVLLDLASLAVATAGIVLQALQMAGDSSMDLGSDPASIGWFALILFVNYFALMMAILFGCALSKSVFFRTRARGFLGFLAVCATLYVMNLLDLALGVVAPVQRYHMLFAISIHTGFNAGMIGYLVLGIAKTAALFFATSYLIERKVNL